MIKRLEYWFAVTEEGARGIRRAALWSFLKFFSFILPMMIIFFFLRGGLEGEMQSPLFYWVLIGITGAIMFIVIYHEYDATYTETYRESENLRIEIATVLKALPLSYFSEHNTADLSQTIMKDVADIEQSLSHAVPQVIGFCGYFMVMSGLLLLGNVYLGLSIVLPVLISFVLLWLSKNYQIKGTTKCFQRLRENSDAFQETIELHQEIRSYGQVDNARHDLFKAIDDTEKVHIHTEFKSGILMNLSVIFVKIVIGLTLLVGTMLYLKGDLSLLFLAGYLLAAVKIAESLGEIYEYVTMMYFYDASYKRIRDLRQTDTQAGERVELQHFDIVLKNVFFSYTQDTPVIQDVSFIARQNEVTALVGPSGCGKSTLLRLISRLYDYDSGSITIDERDINTVSTESLFDKISIVFQDVTLFDTSVLENIRIGRQDATDEEVIAAAKLANAHEFVLNLPEAYHTKIGEDGSKLSGGQRQRISIARAILKDAPIILLDEISASLDVESEMKVLESINHLTKNKTVIIISHRMKSIENADQIVVMDKGYINAIGTHDELMKSSGLYKSMVDKSRATERYEY